MVASKALIFVFLMRFVTLFFIAAPTIQDTTWLKVPESFYFLPGFTCSEHCLSPDKRKGKTNVTNVVSFYYLKILSKCYQVIFLTESYNLPASRCTKYRSICSEHPLRLEFLWRPWHFKWGLVDGLIQSQNCWVFSVWS